MSPTTSRRDLKRCSIEVRMSDTQNDIALTPAQQQSLRRVVALMIPESTEHGVPGADDERIFTDILASLDRRCVRRAQRAGSARCTCRTRISRSVGRRTRRGSRHLSQAASGPASALVAVTVRCYYRDDRVYAIDRHGAAPADRKASRSSKATGPCSIRSARAGRSLRAKTN